MRRHAAMTSEEIADACGNLEGATPQAILRWAAEKFYPKLTMATAFGAEGCCIIHMLAEIEPRVRIFNLETEVPYNPLHDQGYPSIGCWPCTAPAGEGDERAGRWAGTAKKECGLHVIEVRDGGGI